MTAITFIQAFITSRLAALREDRDRGSYTLEQVLWTGGIVLAALAAIGIIVALIATATGRIHI